MPKAKAEELIAGCPKHVFTEINEPLNDGIYYWGKFWSGSKLFVDTMYPDNQMLVGAYPGGHRTGYVYHPYILHETGPALCPEVFVPRPGYLNRYAKRMDQGGNRYYARMVFE